MAGGAAAGQTPVADDAAPAPELERAIVTAALRVGDSNAGLGLTTRGSRSRKLEGPAAFEGLDPNALCLMIDPPELKPGEAATHSSDVIAALTGLIVMPPAVTDSLVEVQTIGRVDGPARSPRRPTRIDAALAQPFARALLEQTRRLGSDGGREPRVGMLRNGSFLAGPDSLPLILTARRYLRVDLDLRLGEGSREASISLILPLDDTPLPVVGETIDPHANWKAAMHATALTAPVLLQAVLPPLRLPLSRLLSLKVGDVIDLPPQALTEIALHGGASGITMPGRKRLPRGTSMSARLGQLNGARAVKIAFLPGERRDSPSSETGSEDFDARSDVKTPVVLAKTPDPGSQPSLDAAASDLPQLPDLPELPDLPPMH